MLLLVVELLPRGFKTIFNTSSGLGGQSGTLVALAGALYPLEREKIVTLLKVESGYLGTSLMWMCWVSPLTEEAHSE